MSVSGISSGNLFNYNNPEVTNNLKQFQQEFQQLGQDLESGNLSAAQQDFVTLQNLAPQNGGTSTNSTSTGGASTNSTSTSGTSTSGTSTSASPIAQEFNQLAQDLQSGNLAAAQQDYTKIQQDFQQASSQAPEGHHHHHHGGDSEFSQLFEQLGQALQSGNLSSAQQVYATLQQDFPQLAQANGAATEQAATTAVSVSA